MHKFQAVRARKSARVSSAPSAPSAISNRGVISTSSVVRKVYAPQSAVHPKRPKPGNSVCSEHAPSPHCGSAHTGAKVRRSHRNTSDLSAYTACTSSVSSFVGTAMFVIVDAIPYADSALDCTYRMERYKSMNIVNKKSWP